MTEIHVNLKRFDIPLEAGGICPSRPAAWIRDVVDGVVDQGRIIDREVNYVLYPPESLIDAALDETSAVGGDVSIGCQGVFVEDVAAGGNFGAFTTSLPAAAAASYGCGYALVGHSEERLKLFSFLSAYDESILVDSDSRSRANATVNRYVADSARRAMDAGLKVTLCVGETAEERGSESVDFAAIESVLAAQIRQLSDGRGVSDLIVAYEPRWAIGPGKTPPDSNYIERISVILKQICVETVGTELPVLYGGGLKAENSRDIGGISTVDGGLIALTKFTEPIGFDPIEMGRIVRLFLGESV